MKLFLEEVMELTRQRVRQAKQDTPAPLLEELFARRGLAPSFQEAVRRKPGEDIKVIAEVKRSSPSRGPIRPDLVLEDLIRDYEEGGASALSVLTEPVYFGGNLDDINRAAGITGLPILRKDFIIDPYQLLESRVAGACAVLLIVAALQRPELEALLHGAQKLGLEALVEVHDEKELETALETAVGAIGINNRDLKTLEVDLETTRRLAPLVSGSRVIVSESGYTRREQIMEAMDCGVDAILVGEALVGDESPRRSLARLRGGGDDLA